MRPRRLLMVWIISPSWVARPSSSRVRVEWKVLLRQTRSFLPRRTSQVLRSLVRKYQVRFKFKIFIKPAVLEDDAFSSNTSSQMLGYTVPAAWDIFKTSTKSYTYDSFDDATLPMAKSANNYLTFDVSLNTDPPVACS